jgi:hypothetical protein
MLNPLPSLHSRRLSAHEFRELRSAYIQENLSFADALVFRVGSEAGFYSEAVSVLECMAFCWLNKFQFRLYSGDANFQSGGMGWQQFFDSFCIESNNCLNRYFNSRRLPSKVDAWNKHFPFNQRVGRSLSYYISPVGRCLLLKAEKARYLTSDFFGAFTSRKFKECMIKWPLFGMDGTVYPEISKLIPFAMRYNDQTYEYMIRLRDSLSLPEDYVSVQMRGGDKIASLRYNQNHESAKQSSTAAYYIEQMEMSGVEIKNLFVLADDYRYIEDVRRSHPDWNVFTLALPDQRGYSNEKFKQLDWGVKQQMLLRLFCAVEICIDSCFHFGHERSCLNNFVKVSKPSSRYLGLFG